MDRRNFVTNGLIGGFLGALSINAFGKENGDKKTYLPLPKEINGFELNHIHVEQNTTGCRFKSIEPDEIITVPIFNINQNGIVISHKESYNKSCVLEGKARDCLIENIMIATKCSKEYCINNKHLVVFTSGPNHTEVGICCTKNKLILSEVFTVV